jgi:hypothetical protein
LNDANLRATFERRDNGLVVYSFEQHHADAAAKLISDEIIEKPIKLDKTCASYLHSDKWSEFQASKLQQYDMSEVSVDGSTIVVLSVKNQFSGVYSTSHKISGHKGYD